jgi:membrane protein implicated in regulation of membrane protease activity
VLSIYIASGIIGIVLISAGAIAGVAEADTDIDAHGIETDHGFDTGFIPFFSLRFWSYFLSGFGLLGILLTYFRLANPTMIIAYAIGIGLSLGFITHWFIRYAKKHQSGSILSSVDFEGVSARVIVAIRPSEPGKVRVTHEGEAIDLIAFAEGDEEIPYGSQVLITSRSGNTVRVMNSSKIFQEELQ